MSRKLSALIVLAAALCALGGGAGCSAFRGHREKKIPQFGVVDPHQPRELEKVSMPTYVVEPPDEIEISVRPSSIDLGTTSQVVRQDGVVDLGFFGDVYVSGLTLDDVEQKIVQHLTPFATRKNIREPVEVSVRLVNSSKTKQFYVIGTVNTQGKFPISGSETVLDGIMLAGLKSNSLPQKAYLVRPHPVGGPDTVLRIDWCGIKDRGDTLTNYQLLPGDRIVVPGGKAPGLVGTLFGGG